MTLGNKKYIVGKWSMGIGFTMRPPWLAGFFPLVNIYCFKLIRFPENGEKLQKNKHYNGIFISKLLMHDIVLKTKAFYFFGRRFAIVWPVRFKLWVD